MPSITCKIFLKSPSNVKNVQILYIKKAFFEKVITFDRKLGFRCDFFFSRMEVTMNFHDKAKIFENSHIWVANAYANKLILTIFENLSPIINCTQIYENFM